MADSGFTIEKDLMVRGATFEIPPPRSGLEEMSKDKVIATEKNCHCRDTYGERYWPNESFLSF